MPDVDHDIPEPIREAAFEWRILIESGSASTEDIAAFEMWRVANPLHADAYDRATTVWASLGTLSRNELDEAFFKPGWKQRFRFIVADILPDFSRSGYRTPALATFLAAAVLSVGIGIQLITQQWPFESVGERTNTAYVTDVREIRTVTLSDGTVATLGAATELDIKMSSSERRIELKRGAALFDVATETDRPFRVTAGYFTATALGTVFDVRNNGGVVRLAVSEGIVEAAYPFTINENRTSLITRQNLRAGQQVAATAAEGISQIRNFQEASFGAWREGRLMYVGATWNELVADANRYSRRPIEIDENAIGLQNLKVTVSFDGRDIDGMLATFPQVFPVEVDQHGQDAIVIRAK